MIFAVFDVCVTACHH